jgi:cystathionine gamma-lyase
MPKLTVKFCPPPSVIFPLFISLSFTPLVHTPSIMQAAIKPNTKMIWLETPSNPTLKLTDIAAVSKIAKEAGVLLVVDNTFMSPFFQQPLSLGADIVMHSITKYMNGHSDVVGGVLATNSDKLNTDLRFIQNGIGAVPSPFDCFLAQRGMKTLHLRMAALTKNANTIAHMMEAHPNVEKVIYPGLKSHPQHELACRQTTGHGGMITFYIKGGIKEVCCHIVCLCVCAYIYKYAQMRD